MICQCCSQFYKVRTGIEANTTWRILLYSCSAKSICIAINVTEIDGCAFLGISVESISISRDRARFCVDRDFLVDPQESKTIWYVGNRPNIVTWTNWECLNHRVFIRRLSRSTRPFSKPIRSCCELIRHASGIVHRNRFAFLPLSRFWESSASRIQTSRHWSPRLSPDSCK
jgi:hypothetical protein